MQKINAVLLCESALNTPPNERAVDPEYVRAALMDGQLWALRHRSSLLEDGVPSKTARETQDVLHMWALVEYSYSQLSKEDRESLDSDIRLFERFPGFDGNAEAEHLAVAQFLIDTLGEYQTFQGRELNSHAPSFLEGYRRMLPVFHRFVMSGVANPLSRDNLVALLRSIRHPSLR